jgi:unsaturated rhamnogalacturonyl hydrolase
MLILIKSIRHYIISLFIMLFCTELYCYSQSQIYIQVKDSDTIKVSNDAIALIDPLINDYDRNGDIPRIVSWTDPLHGISDSLHGGLRFQFTPEKDYSGSDVLSYVLTNGTSEISADGIIQTDGIDWSVEVANMVINTRSTKMNWDYTVGLLLEGVLRVYHRTNDQRYLNFIKEWAQYHITADGTIMADAAAVIEINSLDNIMPGFTLLHLYKETGIERFKLAADKLRMRFDTYPRNPDGCFWHMTDLNGELWLDGLYMGMPFLTTYGKMFGDEDYAYSEAIHQFKLHIDYLMDKATGLLLHAYDYDGSESWALPPYKRSPYAWGRAIGWVVMGLTEILEIIPEDFPQRDSIIKQFITVLKSLANYQDPTTGLWYQVVDHKDDQGNWLETSCSMMFVYSMSRAIQKGFLEESYNTNVESGYKGVLTKISEDAGKMVYLTDICEGTGVSSDIQYYFNRAKHTNDNHGLGTFLIMNELVKYNNLPWHDATPALPALSTIAVTNITSSTAMSGGNITSDGGSSVTARGVCWSTNVNPAVDLSTKTTNGTGIGTYTSSIDRLTSGITYYVRAYATNSTGTGYGNQVSFKCEENLLAYYPLITNTTDITGNNPDMILINTPFSNGGIYCNGIYEKQGYCDAHTPEINQISYARLTFYVEFKVEQYASYNIPVIVAGAGYYDRWLGFTIRSNGNYSLNADNFTEVAVSSANCILNVWHSAAITYDSSTNSGKLFIDGTLVCKGNFTINRQNAHKSIGIVNHSKGEVFKGYLRNIKIYNDILKELAIYNNETNNPEIKIFPNPVSGILTIEYKADNYESINILNSQGVLLAKEKAIAPSQHLDFSKYKCGLYILGFVKTGGEVTRVKVVKH